MGLGDEIGSSTQLLKLAELELYRLNSWRPAASGAAGTHTLVCGKETGREGLLSPG